MSVVAIVVAIAAAALACGSKPVSAPEAPMFSDPEEELALPDLEKALESTVLENYEQLSLGNIDAFADDVASAREVQLVGVTPSDELVGISPKGLRTDRRLYREPKRELRILSKNLHVHLSEDGSVGWVFDEASYRVLVEGRTASIPVRTTALYVRDVERWVLAAEHLSYALPIPDLLSLANAGELRATPTLGTEFGGSRERAAPLLGLVGGFINSGDSHALATGRETLVLLPGPELEFHNESAPSLATVFAPGSTVALKDFRIQFASNGRVAWMLSLLRVHSAYEGGFLEVPLRASFVFERGVSSKWKISQAHISAGLEQAQISERIFGG